MAEEKKLSFSFFFATIGYKTRLSSSDLVYFSFKAKVMKRMQKKVKQPKERRGRGRDSASKN